MDPEAEAAEVDPIRTGHIDGLSGARGSVFVAEDPFASLDQNHESRVIALEITTRIRAEFKLWGEDGKL